MTTIPNDIFADFPFEIFRQPNGDYFNSWEEARLAGYDDDQIWSVTEGDDEDGSEWSTYGPPHHYVNHIGHIATKERHDHNTYYHECWRTAEEAAEVERWLEEIDINKQPIN
jgi:hypothetical protein